MTRVRAGAADFLSKPVDREELLVRSRTLLDLHATRKALEEVRAVEYRRQNEELRSTFRRYVSPAVADRILADGKTPSERYDAVVLFADLRGFTHMSEMLSPADLVKLLNQFFARMTRIVHLAGGAVFHFAGDALMAGFGVPSAQPDFAARAARCAAQMIAECKPMFERWPVAVGLGIGINRGEVIAGNIGSDDFMSYTLIGDTVNVASRLTARARNGEVLMTEEVYTSIHESGAALEALPLPPMTVRGREQPVQPYCLTILPREGAA